MTTTNNTLREDAARMVETLNAYGFERLANLETLRAMVRETRRAAASQGWTYSDAAYEVAASHGLEDGPRGIVSFLAAAAAWKR